MRQIENEVMSEDQSERYNDGMCDCEAGHNAASHDIWYLKGYSKQYALEQALTNKSGE